MFQELVLCSNEGRAATREDGDDGLAALQERLEEAPAAIKATTTALRIKSKFTVRTRSGRWRRWQQNAETQPSLHADVLGCLTIHRKADQYSAGIPSMPNWVAVVC